VADEPDRDRHVDRQATIAGDNDDSVTTLLALTSADDGRMRIDPVPLPPRSDRIFTWIASMKITG
jgi:hypothetical protein